MTQPSGSRRRSPSRACRSSPERKLTAPIKCRMNRIREREGRAQILNEPQNFRNCGFIQGLGIEQVVLAVIPRFLIHQHPRIRRELLAWPEPGRSTAPGCSAGKPCSYRNHSPSSVRTSCPGPGIAATASGAWPHGDRRWREAQSQRGRRSRRQPASWSLLAESKVAGGFDIEGGGVVDSPFSEPTVR